ERGHGGDSLGKRGVISVCGRAFCGEVLPKIRLDQTIVAATADHAAPWAWESQSADPVPLLVAGGGVTAGGTATFGERAAAQGRIGQLFGVDIMPMLVKLAQ